MGNSRLDILFDLCSRGQASDEERREFLLLLEKDEMRGKNFILRSFQEDGGVAGFSDESAHHIFQSILEVVKADEDEIIRPVHRVHFLKTAWFRSAAAVILIITGIMLYYSLFHSPQPNTTIVQTVPRAVPSDAMPGYNRAVLTLSDGKKVELDSATSETIKDGTLSIENNNGQLVYRVGTSAQARDNREWR